MNEVTINAVPYTPSPFLLLSFAIMVTALLAFLFIKKDAVKIIASIVSLICVGSLIYLLTTQDKTSTQTHAANVATVSKAYDISNLDIDPCGDNMKENASVYSSAQWDNADNENVNGTAVLRRNGEQCTVTLLSHNEKRQLTPLEVIDDTLEQN